MKTSSSKPFSFLKYSAIFLFGISAVYFASAYTSINTALTNATQYIQNIILTSDGNQSGITGIELNGISGDAKFLGRIESPKYCNIYGSSCTTYNWNGIQYNVSGYDFNVQMWWRFNIAVWLRDTRIANNTYYDFSAGETRMLKSWPSSMILLDSDWWIRFMNASSGVAGTHVWFTDRFVIDSWGSIGIWVNPNSSYRVNIDWSTQVQWTFIAHEARLGTTTNFWYNLNVMGWADINHQLYVTGGNVWIGTSTPQYPLHVDGSALVDGTFLAHEARLGTTTNFWYNLNVMGWADINHQLYVTGNRVGIGINNPQAALDISWAVRIWNTSLVWSCAGQIKFSWDIFYGCTGSNRAILMQ